MISRKERKIQRALGTADGMPPTICKLIYKRIQYWRWRYITLYTYKWTKDTFCQWLAFKLPKKLVYHCTIRVWAHATTCPSGRKELVYDTTMDDALRRWEKK